MIGKKKEQNACCGPEPSAPMWLKHGKEFLAGQAISGPNATDPAVPAKALRPVRGLGIRRAR
jgi:hypothetical protein